MKAQRVRLTAAFLVVGIFSSCGCRDDSGEFLRRETTDLQRRTVPPGVQMLARSGPTPTGWSETAQWEFETNWDWAQYKQWVASELQPDFSINHVNGFRLVVVRSLGGDTEQLALEAASGGHRLKVRIMFMIYPD